jgi:hypothetical protein
MLRQHELADRSENCHNDFDKNSPSHEKIAALHKKYQRLLQVRKINSRSIQANDQNKLTIHYETALRSKFYRTTNKINIKYFKLTLQN